MTNPEKQIWLKRANSFQAAALAVFVIAVLLIVADIYFMIAPSPIRSFFCLRLGVILYPVAYGLKQIEGSCLRCALKTE